MNEPRWTLTRGESSYYVNDAVTGGSFDCGTLDYAEALSMLGQHIRNSEFTDQDVADFADEHGLSMLEAREVMSGVNA